MTKYLHIIGTGNAVAKSFPNFISEYFPCKDHSFLIIGDKVRREELPERTVQIKKYDHKAVMEQIKKSQYVLIHGLSLSTRTKLRLLQPKYRKKLVWVAWGADLYQQNYKGNITQQFKAIVDTRFKKTVPFFVGIFQPDIAYFHKKYGTKAKSFFAKYAAGSETRNPLYNAPPELRTIKQRVEAGQCVNVIIGHQANPLLSHCTVIDWLARFKAENVHIYIPLSYGDMAYAEKTAAYAERVLGDKVTVLRDFMSQQEYMQLLQDMDIAVFHIDRQIGLGNIYPMMYMQKKIYMKSDGVMYGHFRTDGIEIQPSEALESISFDELLRDADMSAATAYIDALQDTAANIARWQAVFTALK